jgi:ABC-type Fe3+ transport system substrate-binding protein
MSGNKLNRWVISLLLAGGAALSTTAVAADLPKATQKMLGEMQLSTDVLDGLDRELAVPAEWIAGARKEKVVRVSGVWDAAQFTAMNAPFRERYPFLKLEYAVASFNLRAMRPLIALKEGRYLTDVITSFGGSTHHYQEANALEDLRALPNFKNPIDGTGDQTGGTWVGMRLRYWCLAYNTTLIQKEALPKTWSDLLTNPALRNGNIGVANRPQLWLLMLWNANGEQWTVDYINQFFQTVKPQLRKEGTNALLGLTSAGEFPVTLPAADYAAKQSIDKGAPIAWHCPEPIPIAVSQMGILKGNPHSNASRLWVNWFLSKEGQIAQYFADQSPPAHRALQTDAFLPFPEEVKGKTTAPGADEEIPALYDAWNKYWDSAGGGPAKP